jgi:hypothetical protein
MRSGRRLAHARSIAQAHSCLVDKLADLR